jgi:hypothetical protein
VNIAQIGGRDAIFLRVLGLRRLGLTFLGRRRVVVVLVLRGGLTFRVFAGGCRRRWCLSVNGQQYATVHRRLSALARVLLESVHC